MSASCAGNPAIILMADDDEEDIMLVREAIEIPNHP